jgi:transcriptional regulator GlxA family with amidase domain
MERRSFLSLASLPLAMPVALVPDEGPASTRLAPPEKGPIDVAFLISEGATVIDFTGPWEVFQDTMVAARGAAHADQMPFRLFTVADGPDTVRVTGGLRLTPDFTVDNAPTPRVIVVPAMKTSPRVLDWLRQASPKVDLTMSVCTGAFQLARAGLLKGRPATTHHDYIDALAREFPDVQVQRGRRFVESGPFATAAGLTSGIDLALRVVERYFGTDVATTTAAFMEYDRRKLA